MSQTKKNLLLVMIMALAFGMGWASADVVRGDCPEPEACPEVVMECPIEVTVDKSMLDLNVLCEEAGFVCPVFECDGDLVPRGDGLACIPKVAECPPVKVEHPIEIHYPNAPAGYWLDLIPQTNFDDQYALTTVWNWPEEARWMHYIKPSLTLGHRNLEADVPDCGWNKCWVPKGVEQDDEDYILLGAKINLWPKF